MTKQTHQQLAERALKVREHIIGMSAKGGCFIGASLSCVELIVYLYSEWLDLHKEESYDLPEKLFGTIISWEPLMSVRAAKRKLKVAEVAVGDLALRAVVIVRAAIVRADQHVEAVPEAR